MIKLLSPIFTYIDGSTVTIENLKISSRITSGLSFVADITRNVDSKTTTKPLLIKLISLSSGIDGSTVTIENWMFHTYYLISIFPMNE